MAVNGIQPVGSMGTGQHAVLSDKPQVTVQLFQTALCPGDQSTIDPIREELITCNDSHLLVRKVISYAGARRCRQLRLSIPILKNSELEKLRQIDLPESSRSRSHPFQLLTGRPVLSER